MNNLRRSMFSLLWLLLFVGCMTMTLLNSPAPLQIRLVTRTPIASPTVMIVTSSQLTATIAQTEIISNTVCTSDNLIHCSVTIPINISFTKLESAEIVADFQNVTNGSGLAFQFFPGRAVQDFNYLEIRGTATNTFTLMLEYKVKRGERLDIVATSKPNIFPATTKLQTLKIPIFYDNTIDELVLNFFNVGEAAKFSIQSLRLLE